MKRITILLAMILTLSSCGVLLTRETETNILYIDYTPYIEAGFFLSPNEYPGPHTPLGELNIVIDPEVTEAKNLQNKFADGIYQKVTRKMVSKELTSEEILEIAVGQALSKGADGISNLKITIASEYFTYYETKGKGASLSIPVKRYIISGVVFKTNK